MRLREYPPAALPVQDDARNNSASSGNLSADGGGAAGDPEFLALSALGFSKPLLSTLTDRARRNRTSIESELLHSGQVEEAAYYGAMARYLRLPFIAAIDPGSVADIPGLDTQLQRPNQVTHSRSQPRCYMAERTLAFVTQGYTRRRHIIVSVAADVARRKAGRELKRISRCFLGSE